LSRAEKAEQAGNEEEASELYLYVYLKFVSIGFTNPNKTCLSSLSHLQIPCATIEEAKVRLGGRQESLYQRVRVSLSRVSSVPFEMPVD